MRAVLALTLVALVWTANQAHAETKKPFGGIFSGDPMVEAVRKGSLEETKAAFIDGASANMKSADGTPVIILDMFDYSRRRGGPWWDVQSNKDVVVALPKDPMNVEEALIPISQIPKDVRGALPRASRYRDAETILRERGVIREQAVLKESVNWNKVRAERRRKKELEAKRKEADSTAR